jgi:RNase adaptor protein for sRNA GlmZ degradation
MKLESARKKTEKQIKRLRELRKEARDIKNYVERQNRIYELYEKERSLLMKFNKQYEQLRGQN